MRAEIPLARSSLLLNHGPTVLVSSAHQGKTNVMAVAWCMALDYEPPRITAVIEEGSHTRALVEASGELVVNLPTVAQAKQLYAAGRLSGKDVPDKIAKLSLKTSPAKVVGAPLIDGCVGWLECKVVPEARMQEEYDLFILEVVAAWADTALWDGSTFNFTAPEQRTLHHASKGQFFATGEPVRVTKG
ncbi:MAG: flavin reductase family protein [Myxococcaceae bacterium]|nr:flavin reductase family protein [Myxococcaceae bacterium]